MLVQDRSDVTLDGDAYQLDLEVVWSGCTQRIL